jgi:hypothetical protein
MAEPVNFAPNICMIFLFEILQQNLKNATLLHSKSIMLIFLGTSCLYSRLILILSLDMVRVKNMYVKGCQFFLQLTDSPTYKSYLIWDKREGVRNASAEKAIDTR